MPSEPGWSSAYALPDSVSRLGDRCTVPPKTSMRVRRCGFVSYDAPTCHTSHSTPKSAQAYDSAVPHWPAPVSVVSRRDAVQRVVVDLRDRGVGLVRAGRRDALVLVVDPRRRAQLLLPAAGAEERARPVLLVDVEHRPRDLDVPLPGDLLQDQLDREERREVVGPDRLAGARVQRRRRRRRQVGHDVVPVGDLLGLVQREHDLVVAHPRRLAMPGAAGGRDWSGRPSTLPSVAIAVGADLPGVPTKPLAHLVSGVRHCIREPDRRRLPGPGAQLAVAVVDAALHATEVPASRPGWRARSGCWCGDGARAAPPRRLALRVAGRRGQLCRATSYPGCVRTGSSSSGRTTGGSAGATRCTRTTSGSRCSTPSS